MARRGYSVLLVPSLVLLSAAALRAEPKSAADPAGADTLGHELPALGPRLELRWPLSPQRVSFSLAQPIASADGPLQPYAAEAVWWSSGPLSLRSFDRVQQSFELDCRVTCQPVLERSLGVEARLELGGGGVVPETHLFARGSLVQTPAALAAVAPRNFGRFQLGLGGQLDL